MSIRANPRTATPLAASPQTPITFKDELVHSTAALAASHDETVSHILSRLDQLQAKIQTQPESGAMAANASTAATTTRTAAAAQPCAIGPTDTSVHARPASLENVHQDALHRLSSKLDAVERQLQANRENEGLMTQIASRLQQVEPRLQSHASMGDRLARIESQLQSHVSRVNSLEARSAETDPNQARILARINAKLDILEEQNRSSKRSSEVGVRKAEPDSRRSLDTGSSRMATQLDPDMDKQERARFLQARIEKLKELRSKYENADM
jgi:hypothetical protein